MTEKCVDRKMNVSGNCEKSLLTSFQVSFQTVIYVLCHIVWWKPKTSDVQNVLRRPERGPVQHTLISKGPSCDPLLLYYISIKIPPIRAEVISAWFENP